MPIADVLNVSISVSGAGPTRAGFGEPMVVAYHTHYTDRSREYSTLAGMVADGFAVTEPAYLASANIAAQIPAPPAWKVGRRALAMTQTLHLACLSTSVLDTYVFSLRTPGGTWRQVSVASTGVPATDVASIATAVTALSITHLTASSSSVTLTLAMAAGYLLDVQPDYVHMTTADVTADPGIATDLAAILAADSAWYGLLLDCQSPAEITAAAAWTESNGKQFVWNSSDTACATSSTSDIFSTEQALSHERSFGIFSQGQLLSYAAAGWMGRLYPTDPGSENWAFKTISNVPVDKLTDAQIGHVEGKNGSVYTQLFGLNLTQFGKTPGGEWADIVRGTDAVTNALQVGVLALQANTLKVPFTDAGGDLYRSVISSVLASFVDSGFLAEVPAPTVTIPKVSTVSPTNKAARNFPGMNFSAELAGAINSASLNGVLTS